MTDRPADDVRLDAEERKLFDALNSSNVHDKPGYTELRAAVGRLLAKNAALRADLGRIWSAGEEHRKDARHWEDKANSLAWALAAEQRRAHKAESERDAANARAMPLPEAPKDERAEMIGHIEQELVRGTTPERIADRILRAGWRRNP